MANTTKKDATIKIAIQYHLKGDDLETALKKADDRMIAAGMKSANKLNRQQRAVYMKGLRAKAVSYEKYLKEKAAKEEAYDKRVIAKKQARDKAERTRKLRENRTFLDKLGRQWQAFRLKQKRANKDSGSGGFGSSIAGGFSNFGKKLGTISSYGAAITIINGIKQAFVGAIKTAVEFEAALADLQAKSGQTNIEMRAIEATIWDVARATKFSTLEIIEAATQLSKMGFSALELSDVLPAVAKTADAVGESITIVGETIAKTIRAYEMSSRAAGMVSDTMVKAFNRSALDMTKYANAISYVGSIAAQTNTSFQTLIASMEILADRGVTASKIGTGLRNIILKMSEAGMDLDDVLLRISKGQLDVLTLANVVGRRAANQLAILSNNYDELGEKVRTLKELTNDAAIAAAIQQETTSAQWKILWNNIKGVFNVLSDYSDATKDWKVAAQRDLGVLESTNALWDDGASAIERYLAKYPEFVIEYKKAKKELEAAGHDSSHNAILGLMGVRGTGNAETNLSHAFAENEGAIVQAMHDQAVKIYELATTDFQNTVEKELSRLDAESGQEFLWALFGATPESFDTDMMSSELSEKSLDILKQYVTKYRAGRDDVFSNELIKNNLGYSKQTHVEAMIKKIELRQGAIGSHGGNVHTAGDLNKTSREGIGNDVLERNIESLKVNIDAYRTLATELCEIAPQAAADAGIICKTEKKRAVQEKSKAEYFQANIKAEEDYLIAKSNLKSRYGDTEDPNEQQQIKQQLITLERTYRDQLAIEYEQYLIKVRKLQEDYGNRHKGEKNIYDGYVNSALAGASSSRVTEVKNINAQSGGSELKVKAFEADYNAEQAYLRKVSELRLESGNPETSPERKAEIQAELIALNNAYYDKLIVDFKVFLMEIEVAIDDAGEDVDTTAAEEILKNADGTIDNIKTKNNKANKSAENVDKADEPMHWTEIANYAIDGASQVADIYQMFADEKVRIAQEANQRELEAIQNRYDEEIGMQNAALNAGIISQEQAEIARQASERKKLQRMNGENKKLFEIEKKAEIQKLKIDGALNAARAFTASMAMGMPQGAILGGIGSALVLAETAAAVSIASRRKFVPKKFADGGMVEGASHAQGGVPFTVQGSGGYEMEGGEYIVNKRAAAENFAELERINGKAKNTTHFATGGSVQPVDGLTSDMSQAILSALREPVRAFVTDQDLKDSQSERDALTSKTTY